VTFVSHQFITLTVDICVQHGGPEAPRRAGLSARAFAFLSMTAVTRCCCRAAQISSLEDASTHNSAMTHTRNVFVPRDLDL